MATGTDVFLSHNWGSDESGRDNHQRVSLINKELLQRGYKTWFDEDKMTGNIDEKMAKGIEQTEGVIVFLTRKYHDKVNSNNARDNCKKAFLYASEKKTRLKMVPVVMEKCMLDTNTWNGLVGFNLCREMYVSMHEWKLGGYNLFKSANEYFTKRTSIQGNSTMPRYRSSFFHFPLLWWIKQHFLTYLMSY